MFFKLGSVDLVPSLITHKNEWFQVKLSDDNYFVVKILGCYGDPLLYEKFAQCLFDDITDVL